MSAAGAEADAAAAAAAAVLARADAAGLRLRLEGKGRVRWRCRGQPPPAGLLAELRRHRGDVVRLLAERHAGHEPRGVAAGAPYAPDDPYASALAGATAAAADGGASEWEREANSMAGAAMAGADPPGTAAPASTAVRIGAGDVGLGGVAAALHAALADEAEREADLEGWLVLVRPDGRRSVVPPGTVARLEEAGLLPALPEARDAVEAARCARPPSWSEAQDIPLPGDRCVCGGRRWWCDAEAPRGWWCWRCQPPGPLPASKVREVRT